MRIVQVVLVLIWLGLNRTPQAHSDGLYFALHGKDRRSASVEGTMVKVATPEGPKSFPLSAFRTIVPGGRIDEEWQERHSSALKSASAKTRFGGAWWALEQGLTPEAISEFRAAMDAPGATDHAPLLRANRMLECLDRPVLDPNGDSILRRLGGQGWFMLRGRHVDLLHQSNGIDARERLEVLDRVFETFFLSLAARGIELPVPDRRLISVWFARQGDYVQFLRKVEAGPFAETQGYYHPVQGVVFAFDTRTTAEQAQARQAVERQRQDSGNSKEMIADLDRRSLLLDLRWRSVDLGIAAHETVHQLVAASGLAPRFDSWPIWLHEGFSAQFEVVRGGRWAGFGRANDHRLPDWRSIRPAPQLTPLLRDEGLTHGYHRDRYAESWALVYFLRKTRPAEFVTFLELLRTPRSINQEIVTARTFSMSFGENFGEIQAEWRRFMRDQNVPPKDDSKRVAHAKFP